jgi:hypothetical protein
VRLGLGPRAVLDAGRNDVELARLKHDVAIAQLNRQTTVQD